MCDGLSRNLPQGLDTIVANCIAHGRRNFVDIYDHFPNQCRRVIEAFKVVYHNDKVAREQGMSDQARLSHHQAHSQGAMDDLQVWLKQQLDDKLVEPNSALGEAIRYLLRRWDSLTLFLRKAGAPLDNNLCERALKKSILHRKNSMFYKTRRGALVGDHLHEPDSQLRVGRRQRAGLPESAAVARSGCRRAARSLAALELRRESFRHDGCRLRRTGHRRPVGMPR